MESRWGRRSGGDLTALRCMQMEVLQREQAVASQMQVHTNLDLVGDEGCSVCVCGDGVLMR